MASLIIYFIYIYLARIFPGRCANCNPVSSMFQMKELSLIPVFCKVSWRALKKLLTLALLMSLCRKPVVPSGLLRLIFSLFVLFFINLHHLSDGLLFLKGYFLFVARSPANLRKFCLLKPIPNFALSIA